MLSIYCLYWCVVVAFIFKFGSINSSKPINYGNLIHQFPPDVIKSMWRLKKIYTKMCRQTISVSFNDINAHTHTHTHTHIYIYIYIYHHHHVVPLAQISLTLSRHFSLSFIASNRSSGLPPVSSHSCCMYVRAGRPAFARPYVGVHRSTLLMSSSLLLQQSPVCLVRLTWIYIYKHFK